MEKLNEYTTAIQTVLDSMKYPNDTNTQVLYDKEHGHFQLLYSGLDSKGCYFFRVRVHLQLQPTGKVYLLENRTETDIAEELVALGVPNTDIVLAFLPTHVRQYSGYAVA